MDIINNIEELQKMAYNNAKEKGFYDKPSSDGERIALMHSELSEALECMRKNKWNRNSKVKLIDILRETEKSPERFEYLFKEYVKDTVEDELADAAIRIFDYCGKENIPLLLHINAKMHYNSTRPYKHGKQF